MHRVGLGFLILLLICGLLYAEVDNRFVVAAHYGFLVPSLSRIQESDFLDDWRYDVGWGLDLTFYPIDRVSVVAVYDVYPIRYHGLLDRSDVRQIETSGQYGFLHHMSGQLLYHYLEFNSSTLFLGGSYDYFSADQTVEGVYLEEDEEVSYTNTAKIDEPAFGLPVGLASSIGSKLGFSLLVKPIFYYWSDKPPEVGSLGEITVPTWLEKFQFITITATISFGFRF